MRRISADVDTCPFDQQQREKLSLKACCCYSKEAKRILEEAERAEAPAVVVEQLSDLQPLSSPPDSVVVDDSEEDMVFGVTNLRAANARADALFAPYIARRMLHLGFAQYEHRLPDFFGTNALITIVQGELNDGSLPAVLIS